MKQLILFSIACIFTFNVWGQNYPGLKSSNYSGVIGVLSNPANIADSRHRFDFHAFSFSGIAGGNAADFQFNPVTRTAIFEFTKMQQPINSMSVSGLAQAHILGPSIMFTTGKKSGFALTTRIRTMVNLTNLNGSLSRQLIDGADMPSPYSVTSNESMKFTGNAWGEIGLSYARTIVSKGPHFLKGGFTAKYLAGLTSTYIQLDRFRGTVDKNAAGESYFSESSGRITSGFAGLNISDVNSIQSLNTENKGIGGDVGLVYEWRNPQDENNKDGAHANRDKNKYKLKVSVSVLDLGNIQYKSMGQSGSYNIDIDKDEQLYLNELNSAEIDEYNTFFQSKPELFAAIPEKSNTPQFKLPSTLQIEADYHLNGGLYANLAFQLPINNQYAWNNTSYQSFTFTPRYEGKGLGFYVPLNYNSLTQFNAGLSIRLGPLFIGSGSILTASLGKSRQADFFAGFRFGSLHRKAK